MFKARNPIDEVRVKQLSPKYYHRSNVSSEKDSQLRDINVPEDGNCLFWSIAMAYLIPVGNDDVLFQQRYKNLFGDEKTEYLDFINCNLNTTDYENSILKHLVTEVFRNRVVDYMSSHENEFEGFVEGNFNDYLKNMRKPGTWGDEPEIKAISFMLQIGINVRNVHGELILKCNESCNVEIQLSYVDISGGEGSGNHYKFALEANIINNYRSLRNKNKDQQFSPFRNIENSPTRRRNIITSISPGRENSLKKRKYSDSFEESIKDSSIFSGKTSTPLKNQESIEINKVIGISPIKLINENSSNTLCTGEFKKRRRDDSGINLSQRLDNKSNHSQKKLSSKSNQSKPLYLTIISDSGFVSNLWDESNNSQQSSKTYKRQLSFKEEENNRSRKKLVVIQHPAHSVKKVNSFKLLLVK